MEEPPEKKQKYLDYGSKSKELDEPLQDMKVSENNLNCVVSDELRSECPKIEVYAGKITSPKYISETVLSLNEKFPIPDLRHLKRAKTTDILLVPATINMENLKNELKNGGLDKYLDLRSDFQTVSVVSRPPLTKKQYDEARKLWPCNFHPDKYLERLVSCNFFPSNELIQHRLYMYLAYEIGLITQKILSGSEPDRLEDIRGVVIVDTKINSIVSIGYDERLVNPCRHQVMIAIDNVARTQNGGAWEIPTELVCDTEKIPDDGLDHRGIPSKLEIMLKKKHPEVRFGATPSKMKGDVKSDEEVCGPYLCTDYYVYTTNEPCIMCAMALIHARAKRVFFGMRNSSNGGLVSKCKIHTVAALNHHYEVFTDFFS